MYGLNTSTQSLSSAIQIISALGAAQTDASGISIKRSIDKIINKDGSSVNINLSNKGVIQAISSTVNNAPVVKLKMNGKDVTGFISAANVPLAIQCMTDANISPNLRNTVFRTIQTFK